MADWYNTGTVLVCASATEGTPNPGLEAAACGCTVVSTPVGNMPELIRSGENGYLVERRVDALLEGVRTAVADYPRLARQMLADIQDWGWDRRSAAYFRLFRRLALGADAVTATLTS
jgi:glycosyltransferase involved in cell wall biosynthesis